MISPERFQSPLLLPFRNEWSRVEVMEPLPIRNYDAYYTHKTIGNFSSVEFEKNKAYFIDELAKSNLKFENFYFKNLANQASGAGSGSLAQVLETEVTYQSELLKVDTLEKFKVLANKLLTDLIDGEKKEKETRF